MTPDNKEIVRLIRNSRVVALPWHSVSSSGKGFDYTVGVQTNGSVLPVVGRGPSRLDAFVDALNGLTAIPLIGLKGRPSILVDPVKGAVTVRLKMTQDNNEWSASSGEYLYNNGDLPDVLEQAGYTAVRIGFSEHLLDTKPIQANPSQQVTTDIMQVYN